MKTIDLGGITALEPVRGGTDAWYWATDYVHGDLYEAEELYRDRHEIRCSRLLLVHYPDGTVYEPILREAGQYFGYPVYADGAVFLLAVHFADACIRIFRFTEGQTRAEEFVRLPLSAVTDCYNLLLHTAPLTLTRSPHDNVFEIIWPERKRFLIEDRETFSYRDGDRLVFTVWYEDPDYREETVVRSLQDGTVLERYPGDIRIMPNGDRWLIR